MKLVVHKVGDVLLVTKRGRLISDAAECRTISDVFKHAGEGDSVEFTPLAAELVKLTYCPN